MDCSHFQPSPMQSIFLVSVLKNTTPALRFSSSFPRLYPLRALQMTVNVVEALDSDKYGESKLGADSSKEHTLDREVQLDGCADSGEIYTNKHYKESQRRRKIGLANKGRVPWNKGRKHSAETREKIRQRTIKALRDPKVRQKMSERPRTHSKEIKAKIQSSLRRVWRERLKWKRSREQFYRSWAESIAEAAKEGGSDQEQLDWDSYDKIKKEMALHQLQWVENKKRERELAKMRTERAARARAKKMAMLAEKRREQEQRAQARGETKRNPIKKSKEDREELAVAKSLKLKERLSKLHNNKTINGQVASLREPVISHIPSCQKLDLEFIKRERMQGEISLADQIRAARSKRAQSETWNALTALAPSYPSSKSSS